MRKTAGQILVFATVLKQRRGKNCVLTSELPHFEGDRTLIQLPLQPHTIDSGRPSAHFSKTCYNLVFHDHHSL